MTTKQFFAKWADSNWDARQKSLEGLKKEVADRSNPNWNDAHYKALDQLIRDMENYQNFTMMCFVRSRLASRGRRG